MGAEWGATIVPEIRPEIRGGGFGNVFRIMRIFARGSQLAIRGLSTPIGPISAEYKIGAFRAKFPNFPRIPGRISVAIVDPLFSFTFGLAGASPTRRVEVRGSNLGRGKISTH